MISQATLDHILQSAGKLRIAVLGDLFLDRYLDLDATLTEPSIETGRDAYQVMRVRALPGAAGTVINNLASLGVGAITPLAIIGDDGEGFELRQALAAMGSVSPEHILVRRDRRTPTYTKPMLYRDSEPARELNRLDIKNRTALPEDAESALLERLAGVWSACDAMIVVDQVSEPNCGVVTLRVRETLAKIGEAGDKLILADSREHIGRFVNVALKPNRAEANKAVGRETPPEQAAASLARRCRRAVFCTSGADGIWVATPGEPPVLVPAAPVSGAIDPVGAGDSTSAGLACALSGGASDYEAAMFANLVASITIEQIGTTGTATPEQVRQRWQALP